MSGSRWGERWVSRRTKGETPVRRCHGRGERGAAAVEAALVISFIVVPLVLGIMAYGYMLSFRQSVSQAASEGARAAAVAPSWTAGTQATVNRSAVQTAVNQALTSGVSCNLASGSLMRGGANVGTCTLTGKTSGDDEFKTITINYDYKHHPLLPLPGIGFVLPSRVVYTATAEVTK